MQSGAGSAPMLRLSLLVCAFVAFVASGCGGDARESSSRASDRAASAPAIERRAFSPMLEGRWIGDAVAYGPHRDGQSPAGAAPSRAELLEDLRIMAQHWNLIRVYGSIGPSEDMLALIREHALPLRVMLGVWLEPEARRDSTGAILEPLPGAVSANAAQVASAIRLAREYEDIVLAISAGNETQVAWSAHRFPAEQLIRDLRALRSGVKQPVTTADDFNFWNKPESHAVAAEIDFITLHAHPLWNGKHVGEALAWTTDTYHSIQAAHPGVTVIYGETGWATRRHDQGEQARLMVGDADETAQREFHRAITAWARETGTTLFFFEAFDENWKGGEHPDEVEKHWGLFRADRTAKLAMREAGK